MFLKDGQQPAGEWRRAKISGDPNWTTCIQFYEYFHGDNGAGLDANTRRLWTGVIAAPCICFPPPVRKQVLKLGKAAAITESSQATKRPQTAGPAAGPKGNENIWNQPSSFGVSSQHPRVADGTGARLASSRDARRHSGFLSWIARPSRLRLDLVFERLAKRCGGTGEFPGTIRSGGRKFQETLPDLREERHRRFRLRHHRLHRGGNSRRRRGIGPFACTAPQSRPEADARLCSQPHGASIIRGSRSIPNTSIKVRNWIRPRAEELYWIKRQRGNLLLAHGRDRISPLVRYVAVELRQSRHSGGHGGRVGENAGQVANRRACDMAMLILPEVFERTWGKPAKPSGRHDSPCAPEKNSRLLSHGRSLLDLEWTLQQQGFDYTYDKRLYDRLREGQRPARARILRHAGISEQARPLSRKPPTNRAPPPRFDEVHKAAAVVAFLFTRACDFSIKANSKADSSVSRRISFARRRKPSTPD